MKRIYLVIVLLSALFASGCSAQTATDTAAEAAVAEQPSTASDESAAEAESAPATAVPEEPTAVPEEPTADSAEEASNEAEAAPPGTVHTLSIKATGEGWDAAVTTPAGWTEITLANQSDGMRQAAFLRLDDDKSMDDVFAAIEAGMEGVPPWMTSYGGVSGVMPGETRSVTADLPTGKYIVIDPVPEADGIPGMAKGYFMPLMVEESTLATAAPENDVSIELIDYAFNFDSDAIKAGRQTLHVTNSGPQEAHEIVVIELAEGASVHDFIAGMAPDADGPPPGRIVAGTAAFDEPAANFMDVDFEAGGTYAFVCFTPAVQHEGQPHFMHGMIAQFDVPG